MRKYLYEKDIHLLDKLNKSIEKRLRRIIMEIGLEKISFNIPHLYVDMNELAKARNEDPAKYTIGIGQDEMAVAPLSQDPVTLAANAALQMLTEEDKEAIDLIMFATETGIDQSKAASVYVHRLIGLPEQVRSIELKHACYSGTAALQLAKGHVALHPDRKVLVLASDIARYGLNTPGEVTQGAGAVAMLISANPKVLRLNDESTFITKDIMDFWRPNYSEYAYVDGKYSNEQYIEFFNNVWKAYKDKTNETLDDFEALCFHLPYTKMGKKALETIIDEGSEDTQRRLLDYYDASTQYGRKVGNVYTASLYLSLLSLLEHVDTLKPNAKIGLFSYGSGAVGEFFTITLQENYKDYLFTEVHNEMFNNRKRISVQEYEEIFEQSLPTDGSTFTIDTEDPTPVRLTGIKEHMRQYTRE